MINPADTEAGLSCGMKAGETLCNIGKEMVRAGDSMRIPPRSAGVYRIE